MVFIFNRESETHIKEKLNVASVFYPEQEYNRGNQE
jgi:hypothetical protein